MTAVGKVVSGAGFRHARFFALGSDGAVVVATAGATGYEGMLAQGASSLTPNFAEPEVITHYGDDNVFAADTLPPTEVGTIDFKTSKSNLDLDAMLQGVKVNTIGDMQVMGMGTDQQGREPLVGLFAYRQALDTDESSPTFGSRRWKYMVVPKAHAIPKGGAMEKSAGDENGYTIQPTPSKTHLWGAEYTKAADGYTRGKVSFGITEKEPNVVAWKGDGTVTVFNLPTDKPAASAAKVYFWVDGEYKPTGPTASATAITFLTAPAAGVIIFCLYEMA